MLPEVIALKKEILRDHPATNHWSFYFGYFMD